MRPASAMPRRVTIAAVAALAALAACAGHVSPPPEPTTPVAKVAAKKEAAPDREVTIFGVVATPGDASVDPRLEQAGMAPLLRQFLDDCSTCGMTLIKSETKERLAPHQALTLDLKDGACAATELVNPLDDQGKVQLRFTLTVPGKPPFESLVTTPPDQPFYCKKDLPDGRKLLLMVGAH